MKTTCGFLFFALMGFSTTVRAQAVSTPPDLTTGLFLYLPLDGTTLDSSGRGNHGTASGTVTFVEDRFEMPARACLFNGIDASITVPSSESLHAYDQLTIAFWIRVDSMTNNHMVILHKGGPLQTGFANREYAIYKKANFETPYFLVYSAGDSSGQHEVDTRGELMHQWQFFTAVLDRKNHFMAAYVNGALIQQVSDSYSSFNWNEYPLTIGTEAETWSTEHSPFKGALDDIRIYNRALTRGEIAELYGGPVSSPGSAPQQLPQPSALAQNYPNPFNGATLIEYSIAESGEYGVRSRDVRLVVYDILGREVAVLVQGLRQRGIFRVLWNADGFSSGPYFCRLEATAVNGEKSVQTRTMMLVK